MIVLVNGICVLGKLICFVVWIVVIVCLMVGGLVSLMFL